MVINSEQQRVIDELDRNILLLASAGTGKTNTLAYRVAHIIESGRCEAHQILCMTFTNKAAQGDEVAHRIPRWPTWQRLWRLVRSTAFVFTFFNKRASEMSRSIQM